MARTKAQLGSGARLTDFVSASLLARVYPAQEVERILNAQGVNSQRVRTLPAVSGLYFCIALSLYPEVAYEQVFSVVTQGLSWMSGQQGPGRIAKSSVSQMRSKLGAAPLSELLTSCCKVLCDAKRHPEAFFRRYRVMAMDGSRFELPDEPDNAKVFGYPGSRTGYAGYPQAQCAVLVECASHAIVAAHIGACRDSEWSICQPLLAHLDASMLCLADRGFKGYAQWVEASQSGAQLLWRCQVNRKLPVIEALDDGSYLSVIYPAGVVSAGASTKQQQASTQGITVRVIEYSLGHANGDANGDAKGDAKGHANGHANGHAKGATNAQRYRLLTTLLDDKYAPALELAQLYHARWEVEAVFDELKTHLVRTRRVLRSKTAELVRQEFYGWVLAHYAVRWLMHSAATVHRSVARELSFAAHVQILRTAWPRSGAFPPRATTTATTLV